MDAGLGDIEVGDIHVRDGEILAVARNIQAPGVEPIDASGMVALPGFVETHWHTWTSLLRGMTGDQSDRGYFPMSRSVGQFYTADDMYVATRFAVAEALNSGITYVHDWCHNVRGPDFAEADLRALADCGIRGRFSYGVEAGQSSDTPIDTADMARLHADWDRFSNSGMLTLGLAWRASIAGASGRVVPDVFQRDYQAARSLGLPISVHASSNAGGAGDIAALNAEGLLGPHLQLIHGIAATPDEIQMLARSGTTVSLSPYSELRLGYGLPLISQFLDAGVPVGLSVDTTAISGNADMFAVMKVILNIANAQGRSEFKLSPRRVLELATIEGARSMGIDDIIGSVTPGKRADIILIDRHSLNLGMPGEPGRMLVESAQPANIDTVMVDGRILKRNGTLTHLDVEEVVIDATAASRAVLERADWA
jgi:cytosine/adenosine deaminase-related metal-dependent hydrolase